MLREIPVQNGFNSITKQIDLPDVCPLCGFAIDPRIISASSAEIYRTNNLVTTVTLQCPQCENIFHIDEAADGELIVIPQKPHFDLDEKIKILYPKFSRIYIQSLQAQAEELTEICGMGYRKALENLVKSYLVEKNPSAKQKILQEPLAQSIQKIDNENIQILAKAGAWLGNDQVHFLKKHPEYDVDTMKQFIKVLASIIIQEKTVAEAMKVISHHR